MPSPALITLLPHNIDRNPPLCSFASFFIFNSLIPFIYNSDPSSDLTTFIISSISPFEIINAVVREAKSGGQPDP